MFGFFSIAKMFFYLYLKKCLKHEPIILQHNARSRLIKQVVLQYKITKCPNNCTIWQDICTQFARYL